MVIYFVKILNPGWFLNTVNKGAQFITIPTNLVMWYTCYWLMKRNQSWIKAAEGKTLLSPLGTRWMFCQKPVPVGRCEAHQWAPCLCCSVVNLPPTWVSLVVYSQNVLVFCQHTWGRILPWSIMEANSNQVFLSVEKIRISWRRPDHDWGAHFHRIISWNE